MAKILLFFLIVSVFLLTLIFLNLWIKKARKIGFVWEDMNKCGFPKNVAASGGIVVIIIFILGVFAYMFFGIIFGWHEINVNLKILALINVILFLFFTGLADDFLGWKRGGLSIKSRLILMFLASVPLVLVSLGTSSINFPFFGETYIGLFYPLFLVSLGVMGASATYNFLAGFNGLEASQGIIILSALSFVTYINGKTWLSFIALILVSCLVAFYFFNKNPAKVFPGDSLTLSIGGLIAIMAILGNIEEIAVFFFIPYIIETFLKLRGGLKKYSFGKPNKDNSLEMPYEKIYGLTHLSIYILRRFRKNKKVYENEVVYLINAIQILFIVIGFMLFL